MAVACMLIIINCFMIDYGNFSFLAHFRMGNFSGLQFQHVGYISWARQRFHKRSTLDQATTVKKEKQFNPMKGITVRINNAPQILFRHHRQRHRPPQPAST